MASLDFYITKFGKTKGRKLYNAYHREYWKRNQVRMLEYYRNYRATRKGSKDAVSSVI